MMNILNPKWTCARCGTTSGMRDRGCGGCWADRPAEYTRRFWRALLVRILFMLFLVFVVFPLALQIAGTFGFGPYGHR